MTRTSEYYLQLVSELSNFPKLDFFWQKENLYISGKYSFKGSYNGIICSDYFDLKIEIPENYPLTMPKAFEVSGKISSNYHKNSSTELCLGTPADLYLKWKPNNFSCFMKKIVNPYLYRWLFINKFGKEPWADRSHGKTGIIEFYSEYLKVQKNSKTIKAFLFILINGNARLNTLCPCGSGKKLKSCHMHKLNKLLLNVPKDCFQYEFRSLL